jgi:galactokinase
MSNPTHIDKLNLSALFHQHFGSSRDGCFIAWAPGRVNLIGEHTDYNDGFVLPMALNMGVGIYARRRNDNRVRLYAEGPQEMGEFSLAELTPSKQHPWLNYPMGVSKELLALDANLCGIEGVIHADLPIGAGLSSSAALEVASALAFLYACDTTIDRKILARAAQRAENSFVGVNCGIMDQFIALFAEPDTALFLDTRDLSFSHVPLPSADQYVIAMCDSNVKHSLAGSEYNARRRECETALARLQTKLPEAQSLRDISYTDFEQYRDLLPEPVNRRAEHVISEIERTREACDVLAAGDVAAFGRLMNDSHTSLRDLYEVSCKELDILTELAHRVPGVLGSRMTGGGFGGCTVNLVGTRDLEAFQRLVTAGYKQATGIDCRIFVSGAAGPACVTRV